MPDIIQGQLATGRRSKLLARASSKHRSAPMDDVGDGTGSHFFELTMNKSMIASSNPNDLDLCMKPCANHRPDGGIHPRSIATTSQNTNTLHTWSSLLAYHTTPNLAVSINSLSHQFVCPLGF